jgi:triacylglycerol lipase
MSTTWPEAAVMMTLSRIAYCSDIPGQLQNKSYATGGDWSVVWGPVDDSYGNLAYVALSASTGKYAVVIRGSMTDVSFDTLYNWFYNLYVTWQSPWPYFPTQPLAMVSYGSWAQASNLTFASWNGTTLGSFLVDTIPSGSIIAVTGHSLGGNLASVLASWVSAERGPQGDAQDPNTEVYTFAAPSAGNQQFANGFNYRFPSSFRYWNHLDAIPRAWDNLLELDWIYDSINIPTPGWIQDTVDAMEVALLGSEIYYNSYYLQPNGGGNKLTGAPLPLNSDWLAEVTYQHGGNTYLGLLGAPLVNASLHYGVGAVPTGPTLPRPVLDKTKVPPIPGPIIPPPRRGALPYAQHP